MGKNKLKISNINERLKKFFAKYFGFEVGVDITNDVAVLHRRNVVIKNIIFLSNLFYTSLLLILSITTGAKADWAVTIISFPITFLINKLLTKLISLDNEDKTKQSIAMYVGSFYIFLSSILVYVKLNLGANTGYFETVSYVLIYYSIVVISLYQDRKMLSTAFIYLFMSVTFIHLMLTYQIQNFAATSILDFFKQFMQTKEFGDLILRSLVFSLFYLVVYVIVSIGQYMQEERKNELIKRRQVQDDFSAIVGKLFQAVFFNAYITINNQHAIFVQKISEKLATFIGMNFMDIKKLSDYSLIHLRYNEVKDIKITDAVYDDKLYEEIKSKTSLGAEIVKRLELSQNSEQIVRGLVENTLKDDQMIAIMNTLPDLNSQIILLADIYVTLRTANSYKRPYTHNHSVTIFKKNLSQFFRNDLSERFLKFSDEIEELYNSF